MYNTDMKTIYHLLFSLLFVFAFVACDKDDDKDELTFKSEE